MSETHDARGLMQFFTEDHRHCDAEWAELEKLLDGGERAEIDAAWERFETAMERHFCMEEQVVFPAFEARTGMVQGPTAVMRMEHDQMRGVMAQMKQQLGVQAYGAVLDLGDTLLMLTQQHNQKEEAVLYPMAQQHLSGDWPELRERCAGC